MLLAGLSLSGCGGASGPVGWQRGVADSWVSSAHPGERVSVSQMPFQGAPSDLATHILESVVLAPGGGKVSGTHALAECPGAAGEMDFVTNRPPGKIVVFFSIRNTTAYEIRWSGSASDALPPEVLQYAQRRLCRVL